MSKYLSVADTARLIRPVLKQAFPGVKFSVRSDSYAGGASIRVRYEDGPVPGDVEKVVAPFAGAGFDGMIDLKYGKDSYLCPVHGASIGRVYGHGAGLDGEVNARCCEQAESVSMGADYVFVERSYSPEFRAEIEAKVAAQEGVEEYDGGRYVNGQYMSAWFHRLAVKSAA